MTACRQADLPGFWPRAVHNYWTGVLFGSVGLALCPPLLPPCTVGLRVLVYLREWDVNANGVAAKEPHDACFLLLPFHEPRVEANAKPSGEQMAE
jgi:hypothetical protein